MQSNTVTIEFLNPDLNFYDDIQKCIDANCEIIDCIIEFCYKNKLEFEQVVPLIKSHQVFKSKLTREAETLHFIKKRTRVPR